VSAVPTGPQFTPATRKRTLLRLALSGPSGSGKTYTGLRIGTILAASTPLRLAVVDTEHGSASKYADEFAFDVLPMSAYDPRFYIEAIKAAAATRQYSVLLIDSLSHAWGGTGGVLDKVDRHAKANRGDSFGGWRETRPLQRDLIEAMVGAPMHVIVTMRSKQAYEIEKDERGKTKIRKLGLKPEQADGIEYEFDIAGELDTDHVLAITKSRAKAITDNLYPEPGEEFAADLIEWIQKGRDPDPPREAAPAAPPAAAPAPEPAAPAAAPPASAAPEPEERDDRKVTAGQVRRLQTLARQLPVISSGELLVLDLARYAVRNERAEILTSTTDLSRFEVELVFDLIDQMAAGENTAGAVLDGLLAWLETQPLADEIPDGSDA
jgi:hypothetical protein